jgi:hypothetical protein
MELVIVVKVPDIADVDGPEADNAIAQVQEHMKSCGYEWWLTDVLGTPKEGD